MQNHLTTVILTDVGTIQELSFGITPPVRQLPDTPLKGGVGGNSVAQSSGSCRITAYNDRGLDADTRHSPCGYATATSGLEE